MSNQLVTGEQPHRPQNTRLIPLSQGKFAIVDAADYEWLNQLKWCAQYDPDMQGFYAVTRTSRKLGKQKQIRMQRLILGLTDPKIHGDHINHDTLDNRRNNLRPATTSQNGQNRKKHRNNTSGFMGVSWINAHRKYRAQIEINGKAIHLGHFDSAEAAARRRDAEALKLHGEFAALNFPDEPVQHDEHSEIGVKA